MLKRNHVPHRLVLHNRVQQKMIGSSKRSDISQLYFNGAYIFSKFIVLIIFMRGGLLEEIYWKLKILKVTFIC